MPKKKPNKKYISNMQDQVTFSKAKLIWTILGAVLSTMVVTAFSLLRVANSDHFLIIANQQSIERIENDIVPRSEWKLSQDNLDKRLDSLESKIDQLLLK